MSARVVIFAQLAPPSLLTAARRTAGMVKYLDRLGYEVTLVTSLVSGPGEGVPGATRTIRSRDLMVSGLNWRRGSFERFKNAGAGEYSPTPSKLAAWVPPDLGLVGWVPFALPWALRLAATTDCVVTTAPPYSAHLIGLALRRRGVPWVADFRDGWCFQSGRPEFGHELVERADERLEALVARSADRLVAVTEPIAADLEARHSVGVATITNGFDPEEPRSGDASDLLRPGRHSLVYTGTLAYSGLTPAPLLEGLRRLGARDPAAADRVEILFAGPLSDQERGLVEAPDLGGRARALGMLGRDRVLALQRAAGSLVVITNNETGLATGKLYEYLAAERPILVLGPDTAAARVVRETGSGFAVSATDPDAIADALARLPQQRIDASSEARARYSYPLLARRLADEIERARSLSSGPVGATRAGPGG
jgi:glycosyltransferase involved in cell wall biosynthesis